MLGLKFAHLIERHSRALADTLVHQLQTNDRTKRFRDIAEDELREDVNELYLHLTEWLVTKTEGDVQQRQARLGAYRAEQKIPIEEFLWAIILSKRNIFDFLKREVTAEVPYELMFEMEFMQSLDEFFDRALYHAIAGYVHRADESAQHTRSQIHA